MNESDHRSKGFNLLYCRREMKRNSSEACLSLITQGIELGPTSLVFRHIGHIMKCTFQSF